MLKYITFSYFQSIHFVHFHNLKSWFCLQTTKVNNSFTHFWKKKNKQPGTTIKHAVLAVSWQENNVIFLTKHKMKLPVHIHQTACNFHSPILLLGSLVHSHHSLQKAGCIYVCPHDNYLDLLYACWLDWQQYHRKCS